MRCKVTGAKAFLIIPALRKFHEYFKACEKGEEYMLQPVCVLRGKQEYRFLHEKKDSDLPAAQNKIREFFIPCLIVMLLLLLIGGKRLKFECSRY